MCDLSCMQVRITDSSTVTAGIGQMPSVPIVGQIPSNTSVSFPRPSTTVDGDWVVFESRDQPACPVEAAGEVHSRSVRIPVYCFVLFKKYIFYVYKRMLYMVSAYSCPLPLFP